MSTKSASFLTDRKYWDKMLQARSWGGVSRYTFTSWALPSCPHQLALLVEISYRKDKWLFDSLLREWGEGEKGLDSQGVLWAPIQFSIRPCEQGASNLGTHWSPSSFEEVKPAAWWTRCWDGMDGTHPARAGGGGGGLLHRGAWKLLWPCIPRSQLSCLLCACPMSHRSGSWLGCCH